MAADLNKLDGGFKNRVVELVRRCAERGIEVRPNSGLRDPFEQARLWRQSRSIEEIKLKINELKSEGAMFLVYCIEYVGPQHGMPVTDTVPGVSWHQWGEALDCFWVVDDKAEWSARKLINGLNGYHVYTEEAVALGLTAGGQWTSFKDWPHIQLRNASNALNVFPLLEIDREMKKRFGTAIHG